MDDIIRGVWPFLIAEILVVCAANAVPITSYGAVRMVHEIKEW